MKKCYLSIHCLKQKLFIFPIIKYMSVHDALDIKRDQHHFSKCIVRFWNQKLIAFPILCSLSNSSKIPFQESLIFHSSAPLIFDFTQIYVFDCFRERWKMNKRLSLKSYSAWAKAFFAETSTSAIASVMPFPTLGKKGSLFSRYRQKSCEMHQTWHQ